MSDYGKDRAVHLAYPAALEKAKNGWVIAREGWNGKYQYVFLATSGTFDAKDFTVGTLQPFLVMRTAQGTYVPWLCSQTDALADDWIAITRQTMSRQVPQQERQQVTGFATSDSDFDAD